MSLIESAQILIDIDTCEVFLSNNAPSADDIKTSNQAPDSDSEIARRMALCDKLQVFKKISKGIFNDWYADIELRVSSDILCSNLVTYGKSIDQ